jgi:hypothetical protein
MKFTFRVQKNTDSEIKLGHKLSFTVAEDIDAISISANPNGFTPLTAAFRAMNLNHKDFEDEIFACRKQDVVIELKNQPFNSLKIILVPPTRGLPTKHHTYEYYMTRILEICNINNLKNLHFTHYGFLNGGYHLDEVLRVMTTLLHPLVFKTLEHIYFEVDERYYREFTSIFRHVNYIFKTRNEFYKINAPEFEYVIRQTLEDGSTWREFVRKDRDIRN